MTVGIYCYKDLQDNDSIVYIGKDAYIHRDKRHKDHHKPSLYDAQQINRVLQNNPDRYSYEVLKEWNAEEHHPKTASLLERLYIRRYDPKFNFTKGGDGLCGFKHSEETKKKISEHHKQLYAVTPHHMNGKHHSEETKLKMSIAHKGEKNYCWKDYPRIIKNGVNNGNQTYALVFEGKVIKQSIYYDKLKKELNTILFGEKKCK